MIRKFELSDLKRVLEIEKTAFPKSPYSKSTFLHYYKNLRDNFLVHISKNKITGYIIFYSDGHIISIAVDKEYRRKGIGTQLVKEAICSSKHKHALVEVRKGNINAINFYEKIGFRKIGIIKNYYRNEDAIVLII